MQGRYKEWTEIMNNKICKVGVNNVSAQKMMGEMSFRRENDVPITCRMTKWIKCSSLLIIIRVCAKGEEWRNILPAYPTIKCLDTQGFFLSKLSISNTRWGTYAVYRYVNPIAYIKTPYINNMARNPLSSRGQ